MSLRSPLGRVLGLGSAKGGSGHWYAQRVTAVALVILGLWFIASLALLGLQVVFEDYISDKGTRLVVLVALKFALVVAALVGVFGVLRIAFGVQA